MKNLLLFLFTVALSFLSFGMSVETTNDVISWKYSHDAIMYHEQGVSQTPIVKMKERIHFYRNRNLIDNNIAYKKMLSTIIRSKSKKFNNITFFSEHSLE